MRIIFTMIFWFLPLCLFAQEWEDQQLFNDHGSVQNLRIISSTDTSLFAPVIESFVAQYPETGIEYLVNGTSDINEIFRANPQAFDIVISSAMDLQFKIANDGLARTVAGISLPPWAQWRQSLFAFTSEPAAIVVNRDEFAGIEVPKNRQELIGALRARPEVFRGRVGTYDVRLSGLGYLFATQDARTSETYWRLMEVMGSLDVRLYCCSGDMIDDLANGTLAVAYNVLGSYATARLDLKDTIEIILPSDFPTTMMRTAIVSIDAPHPEPASAFIRHLIALQSNLVAHVLPLPPLNTNPSDAERATITLEPALMTFLDTFKRRRFLTEWEASVIQK